MTETTWILMEVIDLRRETPLLTTLRLTPVLEGGRFDFQAGQCVKILCPGGRESYFAMASEPEEKQCVEFLIKDQEGSAAHELCQVQIGDQLKVGPPFGKGFPIDRLKGKDVLLIGIGSGLSPLRSVLKSILRRDHQFGQVALLYGARTPEDIPYRSEFDRWAKLIRLEIALSRLHDSKPIHSQGEAGRFFRQGHVTDLIPKLSLSPGKTIACLCGTKVMQEEVTKLLERAGVSKENILLNY